MFNLNQTKSVNMGLRKMMVDFATMSANHAGYVDKYTKFKYNTSGHSTGFREKILSRIGYILSQQPNIAYDVNEIYSRLLDKLEDTSTDFSLKEMESINDIGAHIWQHINWLFKTIFDEIKKGKGTNKEEQFTLESDKDEDNPHGVKESSEDKMFKQGLIETFDITKQMTEQQARELLVKSLDSLKIYQDFLLETPTKKINILRLLQAHMAHLEFVQVQEEKTREYGEDDLNFWVLRASSKNDLIATLGFDYGVYVKHKVKINLAQDYVSKDRKVMTVFKEFLDACEVLEIPVLWLDVDEIMDDDYIRRLHIALNQKNTVCVSEYDLEELQITSNLIDLKKNYIRTELLKQGVPQDKIPNYFNRDIMDKIYQLKVEDIRNLNTIVSDIRSIHDNYMRTDKFSKMKEGDKRTDDIMKESPEYKRRERISRTSLLYGVYKNMNDGTGDKYLPGVFSTQSLKIINIVTEQYFRKLLYEEPETVERLRMIISKIVEKTTKELKKDIVANKQGFLMFEDTGEYLEIKANQFHEKSYDNKKRNFVFNKWLVNEKGFFVSKFLDADVRVREELIPHYACKIGQFDKLIIIRADGEPILNGVEDPETFLGLYSE